MKRTPSTSRSRPSSRPARALWAALAAGLALSWAEPAPAQSASPILTVDQDRLFSETELGAETLARLEEQAKALAAENQRIETELIAEERQLTEQRMAMEPAAFRELADAFDAKVQRIRDEQDEKARLLNRSRDEARSAFFRDVAVTISEIVRERGGLVVIDRRDVFLSADSIDITDEAIRRVNESGAAPKP